MEPTTFSEWGDILAKIGGGSVGGSILTLAGLKLLGFSFGRNGSVSKGEYKYLTEKLDKLIMTQERSNMYLEMLVNHLTKT